MPNTAVPAATAIRAVAGAPLRQAIAAAGAALASKGSLSQQVADSATGSTADYVLGSEWKVGAAIWASTRAEQTDQK